MGGGGGGEGLVGNAGGRGGLGGGEGAGGFVSSENFLETQLLQRSLLKYVQLSSSKHMLTQSKVFDNSHLAIKGYTSTEYDPASKPSKVMFPSI